MFTKSGSFAALLGVAVIAAGSLAECGRDAGRSLARQLGPQLPNPQEGFGPVSEKELRVREDGGRDLELSAESTRVRTWGDAGALLDPVGRCGEGRRITILSQEPGMENFSTDAPFPARTRFVMRVACEGSLANEIPWASDMDWSDAHQAAWLHLKPHLGEMRDGTIPGVAINSALFSDGFGVKKYEAYNALLGAAMSQRFSECGGPVTLVDAVAVVKPSAPDASTTAQGTLMVGTLIDCGNEPRIVPTKPDVAPAS